MGAIVSLAEFYKRKFNQQPENLVSEFGHFNAFRIENIPAADIKKHELIRYDFHKICLLRGNFRYHYGPKSIEASGTTLLFCNPQVPYSIEPLSGNKSGYFCIFKEPFLSPKMKSNINELPMFTPEGKSHFFLDEKQDAYVSAIFSKMLNEIPSDYLYKNDLLCNYVMELIHYAMKIPVAVPQA